jgi:hypothetical protein
MLQCNAERRANEARALEQETRSRHRRLRRARRPPPLSRRV